MRLFGIDAPEHDQLFHNARGGRYRCGQVAANVLSEFIGIRPVACVEVDRDRYGRTVAVCTVEKADLADWLVRRGLAIDWPLYSKGAYAPAELEAKRRRLGLWEGDFVEPWRYRACVNEAGRPEMCSWEGQGSSKAAGRR